MWSLRIILAYNVVRDTLQVESVFVLLMGTSQFPWQGVYMPQYPVFFFQEVKVCFFLNWDKSLSRMLKVGYDVHMQKK